MPQGRVARASVFVLTATLVCGAVEHGLHGQEPEKTVADGVFTDAQAVRGAASYDTACAQCHRPDMTGNNGPALRDERFARIFAGKDLKTLYDKIATTMPRMAPGSLGDDVYLDIVAHVLRENGFPAGPQELTTEALGGVRVLPGRVKPPPAVGDFSYVEVIGCLTPGPGNTWLLTNATQPVSVAFSGSTPKPSDDVKAHTLGNETFRLLDAMAYNPESHKGQKIYIRGLLIKLPSEQRMTISSFETIAPGCSN